MRVALIGLAAALLIHLGGPARAQSAEEAIRGVIAGQIEAFKADDFETAFAFASPEIKRLFGSPARFGAMVQGGYPMVWRPGEVRFGELDERDGRTVQSVLVTDRDGALHVLDYHMVSDPSGWLINGVTIRRSGDAGA